MGIVKAAIIRLAKLVGVILVVSFLTFSLTKLLPGDPVNVILGPQASNEELRTALEDRLGLNESFIHQYVTFVGNALHGDLGYSYDLGFSTTDLLKLKVPATREVVILAQFFSLLIAAPAAMYSAYKANSKVDRGV